MIQGRIKTADLRRLVYNGLIYSNKNSQAQGWTAWSAGLEDIRVTTSDDYVALSDTARLLELESSWQTLISQEELKKFQNLLKENKDEVFDLKDFPGDDANITHEASLREIDQVIWDLQTWKPISFDSWAISPDRLRKLSLIKADEDYPIDIQAFEDQDELALLGFKVGPDLQGVIAPLDRNTLGSLYEGAELWRV